MKLAKSLIYPKNIKRVILALLLVMSVTFITMGAVFDVALKNVTLIQTNEFEGTSFNTAYGYESLEKLYNKLVRSQRADYNIEASEGLYKED